MTTIPTNRLLLLLWTLSFSLGLQASELSFVRIADILAESNTIATSEQYIGNEMRTVLIAPETSTPSILKTQKKGAIIIRPQDDLPALNEENLGIRIQLQYFSESFMPDEAKRLSYDFLSRDVIAANTPVTLRASGKPEAYVRVWARQVMPQTLDITTRTVRVPAEAHLDFGVALQDDWRIPRGAQVRFKVTATTDATSVPLYDEVITRHEPWEPVRWRPRSLDLSALANQQVQLVFSTEKVSDDPEMIHAFPLWGNPILYSTAAAPRCEKTNIIMIALDTLRADHLGCYGYKRNTSPNIDAFAAANVLFENAIAPAPWTTPSFASIFTGRLPAVHEAGQFYKNHVLDSTYATLAEQARNEGMLTAAFTEGIAVRAQLGFSRGFDQYSDGDFPFSHQSGTAEASFRSAAAWLDTYGHLPFFLFVHTYEPHDPYEAPDPWNLMFADPTFTGNSSGDPKQAVTEEEKQHMRDRYDGSIAYTDHWVGWFLEQVKHAGLHENTVVVLFSDHGEAFWEHGHYGHLASLYDDVLHVPVILAVPDSMKCSKRINRQIASTDIFATLLDILNLPIPDALDSHSLLPLLQKSIEPEGYPRTYVSSELRFFEMQPDQQSGRSVPIEHLLRSLRSQEEKYIATSPAILLESGTPLAPADTIKEELYDISSDPKETNNLAPVQQEETTRMRKHFQDFFAIFGIDVTENRNQDVPLPQSVDHETLEALKTLGYL